MKTSNYHLWLNDHGMDSFQMRVLVWSYLPFRFCSYCLIVAISHVWQQEHLKASFSRQLHEDCLYWVVSPSPPPHRWACSTCIGDSYVDWMSPNDWNACHISCTGTASRHCGDACAQSGDACAWTPCHKPRSRRGGHLLAMGETCLEWDLEQHSPSECISKSLKFIIYCCQRISSEQLMWIPMGEVNSWIKYEKYKT